MALYSNTGYCNICMEDTTFVAEHMWLRDHYFCQRCRTIPRQRALVEVLTLFRPAWRTLIMHECSPSMGFFFKQCPGYSASQFFADVPPGEYRAGFRSENLEHMTIASESFDVFITQDVFEHVFNPDLAMREIMRVLRPGGIHIFTAPKHKALLRGRLPNQQLHYPQPHLGIDGEFLDVFVTLKDAANDVPDEKGSPG